MTIDVERFASYLALPGFGRPALFTLGASRLQVVGLGAVGAPAAAALVRAGAGVIAADDVADVSADDPAHGLCPADSEGELRAAVASRELRALRAGVRVEPVSSALRPSVVLVCAESPAVVQAAAEAARVARIPHVVAVGGAAGGHVVTVPVNAPCYACAGAPVGEGACDAGVALALGGLAATEALLVLAAYAREPRGRCVTVASAGEVTTQPTVRRPGCACRPR